MSNVIGIDSALKGLAICYKDKHGILQNVWIPSSTGSTMWAKVVENTRNFSQFIESNWEQVHDMKVALEDGLIGRNTKQSLFLNQLVGLIHFTCESNNIPTLLVPVSTWKKEIVLNGSATKDYISEFVHTYLANSDVNFKSWNEDQKDAFCIYLYGLKMLNLMKEDGNG